MRTIFSVIPIVDGNSSDEFSMEYEPFSIKGDYTLLKVKLITGRTHQIRVHFSAHGHPLIGDPLYLRRIPAVAHYLPASQRLAALDFPRQALHAMRLGFTHPDTGEKLSFETPLPHDMASLLTALR